MISEDSGSSSESEAAADLLESVLGISDNPFKEEKTEAPERGPKGGPQSGASPKRDRNKKKKKESKKEQKEDEEEAHSLKPYKGLKLELKGLPLEVGPACSSNSSSSNSSSSSSSNSAAQTQDLLRLQPHQKVLRLSIDGDPTADPAA
ncbi:hypothetical protein, conserved [Eimeria praecox]|uniref:Uncharacterized protein n=1 Tax=Eimeria praecox TaxID=51316 RepID=U6G5X5_9EIME|nr:hypothetical protein, conserved [Eimeria praecox]